MNDWEIELFKTCELLQERLTALKDSGVTYISKISVAGSKMTMPKGSDDKQKLLKVFQSELDNCQRCKLCADRKTIVFGTGNPNASLVFVGEAPGAEEDKKGEPFVGRAGQLLTKMINAMGLEREDVYLCNVIKCRPPENRNPQVDEIDSCEPFLKKQLAIIRPKVIVGLGSYACQTLLKVNTPISKIRGQIHTYDGIAFMPTYHPAYLLRNPVAKKDVWQDLQTVMAAMKQ